MVFIPWHWDSKSGIDCYFINHVIAELAEQYRHDSRWVGGATNFGFELLNCAGPALIWYVDYVEKTMFNICLTAGWAHNMMERTCDGNLIQKFAHMTNKAISVG